MPNTTLPSLLNPTLSFLPSPLHSTLSFLSIIHYPSFSSQSYTILPSFLLSILHYPSFLSYTTLPSLLNPTLSFLLSSFSSPSYKRKVCVGWWVRKRKNSVGWRGEERGSIYILYFFHIYWIQLSKIFLYFPLSQKKIQNFINKKNYITFHTFLAESGIKSKIIFWSKYVHLDQILIRSVSF